MSVSALRLACRNAIRAASITPDVRDSECAVTNNGRPHPRAANLFISVHGGEVKEIGANGGYYRHESVGIEVTISLRASFVPQDMRGEEVTEGTTGLERFTSFVTDALHGIIAIGSAANALITDATKRHFLVGTLLRFERATAVQERDYEWWTGDENTFGKHSASPQRQIAGVSQTLHFGGLERIRKIGA